LSEQNIQWHETWRGRCATAEFLVNHRVAARFQLVFGQNVAAQNTTVHNALDKMPLDITHNASIGQNATGKITGTTKCHFQ